MRITKASGGEYGYPSNTLPTNSKEYNAKMRASAELHNLLENSTYDHWAADKKNHAEATLGFDYYKTVFIVDGKVFEGLINIANSENGRGFYDITNIKEVPDYTRKYAAPLARSSSTFGNLYMATIRQTEGNSQEKSSGKASVEVNPDDTATQRLKEQQFELIQNNHPKEDWDYQTWINSVDDVKTYQEAVDDDRAGTPDFDDTDIDRALKTGRVRVYSSHRIRIGTFPPLPDL